MARRFGHGHDVIDLYLFGRANPKGGPRLGLHFLGIADNVVDLRHGGKAFGCSLGRASGDNDLGIGMGAAQLANILAGLAHSLGGDGAGVDDHSVL